MLHEYGGAGHVLDLPFDEFYPIYVAARKRVYREQQFRMWLVYLGRVPAGDDIMSFKDFIDESGEEQGVYIDQVGL